jgi:hypothetical protein
MKRLLMFLGVAGFALLLVSPSPVAGEGETGESLKAQLIRHLDERLAAEMTRLRAELVAEIDRRLEGRESPDALPAGYEDLLRQVRDLRAKLAARPAAPAAEPKLVPRVAGTRVGPVPAWLRAQLGIAGDAQRILAVRPDTAGARLGLREGDILLTAASDGSGAEVLRGGRRVSLSTEHNR